MTVDIRSIKTKLGEATGFLNKAQGDISERDLNLRKAKTKIGEALRDLESLIS